MKIQKNRLYQFFWNLRYPLSNDNTAKAVQEYIKAETYSEFIINCDLKGIRPKKKFEINKFKIIHFLVSTFNSYKTTEYLVHSLFLTSNFITIDSLATITISLFVCCLFAPGYAINMIIPCCFIAFIVSTPISIFLAKLRVLSKVIFYHVCYPNEIDNLDNIKKMLKSFNFYFSDFDHNIGPTSSNYVNGALSGGSGTWTISSNSALSSSF